ncbi:MAG TPA: cell envelope integrity protein TolA [Methylophilaceae bacterium]|nr:cell envelope integrity protein TolA [Methylophilaceae bacterium]
MIRTHENPLALRAGALSVLVHGVLLAILLISFNWKTVQPMNIAEVELWDSLPSPEPVIEPVPEPPKPEPVIEPEPKPVIESKPEPVPEPKAEIQIKKEPIKEPPPKKVEKPKPDPAIKAKEAEKKRQEEIKKLQQMLAAEDQQQPRSEKNEAQEASDKAAQAASAGEVNKYIARISSKIRSKVNKQLCGTGNPELEFAIALMPTGEVNGNPKLLKGSGIEACDEAVERAILQAQPLPVPSEPDLFSQFRTLKLKFRPNADN